MITVLLFGHIAEAAGLRRLDLAAAPTADALAASTPQLAGLRPKARIAINGEWSTWDAQVQDGDEVAILPPWSAL